MLTVIYWVILLLVAGATLWEGVRSRKWGDQATAALVLIPLILRLLWTK
jgi:hypothetical protein